MEMAFVILIAMALIASFCHGLWVLGTLVAKLFRSLPPPVEGTPTENPSKPDQDRLTAERYLRRLYYKGVIPEEDFTRLLKYTSQDLEKVPPPTPTTPSVEKVTEAAEKTIPETEPAPESDTALEIADFLDEIESETEKQTAPSIVPQETPPPEKKRPLGSLLQAFMEEKNIRWGELISGLLIVGSAIGLVVSLWSTLKNQIPYLPALLFLLATAAIHGAGLYTFKRWKLEATSRGLLLITVLLVPLNFLAAIRLSDHRPATDPLFILALTVGFAAFGWMVHSASRILVSFGRWPLLAVILGTSAGQIVISRLGDNVGSFWQTNLLALVPVACFVIGMVRVLQESLKWESLSDSRARELVTLVGLSIFAVLAPCWLLIWNAPERLETFARLTPQFSMMETLLIGFGLILHHRKGEDEAPHWSLAGSSLVIFSLIMLLVNFVIAWPRVEIMIALGIVNGLSLTLLAFRGRFPLCHIPALLSLTVSILLGFHVLTGTLPLEATTQTMLIEALLLGRTGLILFGLGIGSALVAGLLKRFSLESDARFYLYGTAGFAIGSSLIAVYAGFVTQTDDISCTLTLLFNSILFLIANWQVRRQFLSAIGSFLSFLTLQHALCVNTPVRDWLSGWQLLPDAPFDWGCLIHATIGLIFLLTLHYWARSRQCPPRWSILPRKGNAFTTPIAVGSMCSSVLMIPNTFLQNMPTDRHACYAFWLMLIWVTLALILRSDFWFLMAQLAGTVGTLYTATAVGNHYDLWTGTGYGSPRYWLFHILAIAIWNGLGSLIHSKKFSKNRLGALSRSCRFNLQPVLLVLAILSTGLVLFLSLIPAIAADFAQLYRMGEISRSMGLLSLGLALYLLGLTIVSSYPPRASSIATRTGLILGMIILSFGFLYGSLDGQAFTLGFSLQHVSEAFGFWSWSCLGLLFLACLPYLNSRFQKITSLGILFILYLVPYQVAGYFIEQGRAADALRWGLAVYSLLIVAFSWQSKSLVDFLGERQIRLRYLPRLLTDKPVWRDLSMLGASLPVLLLTAFQVSGHWSNLLESAVQTALSTQLGSLSLFCLPLLALVIAAVLYALHFRSPGWMLLGSHYLATTVVTGVILTFTEAPRYFELAQLIQILTCLGCAAALYGIFWLVIERKINTDFQEYQSLSPLDWPLIRVHLTSILCLVVFPYLIPFLMNLRNPEIGIADRFPSMPIVTLITLVVSGSCIQLFSRTYFSSMKTNGLTFLSLALVGFLTVLCRQHTEWSVWRVNLLMEAGLILIAAFHTIRFVQIWYRSTDDPLQQTTLHRHFRWTQLICALLLLFALRGGWSDLYRPYPGLMIAAAGTALYFTLGLCLRKQIFAWAALGTTLLGTILVMTAHWTDTGVIVTVQNQMDLAKWLITTAAVIAGCWTGIDVYRQRDLVENDSSNLLLHLQQIVAGTLSGIVLFYTLLIAVARTVFQGAEIPVINDPAGWIALGSVTTLLVGLLWDRRSRFGLSPLFMMGLCGIGTMLSNETELRTLAQHSGIAVACYACLIGGLWRLRGTISRAGSRLAIPNRDQLWHQTRGWLPQAVSLLCLYVILALLHSVLRFEDQAERWWSVAATFLTGPALLALSDISALSERFKKRALLATGVGCIYVSWALLPARGNFYWLDHLIRLLETVSLLSLLTTIVLVKWPGLSQDWSEAIRKSARTFLSTAGMSLLAILISETALQLSGIRLELTHARIAVVSGALVLLSAALILMAAVPKYDPFRFSLKQRMWYVYASEIVLTLLFLHIYLTLPELFRGYLLPYWPYIVIVIAFAGAGVGEFFERIGLKVLSEPLQRTGTFLPLLPALSFWIHGASTQASPVAGEYSMVLLLISLVYVVMSLWRKSFVYTTLAALAGNGAWWAFWAEQGQILTQHPQLWLIPPALSVLIATHLNREKLTEAQLTAIRYFATITIYISSTGDMFIAGVANSIQLPMILCGLSVLGIFAGMLLRVRAFLYVGTSFLVLSIVSMIWHASQSLGHIWPWWAFGIGLGICILTLFGLFEKRRNEMQELVGKLKTWDH